MQLYEQIVALNVVKSVLLSIAISVFFSAVRTGMALQNKHNLVHSSVAVFWLDQLTGVAAGLLSYALLHDWFAQDKPFSQLAIIGIAAFTSAELLSVAKVGVIRWLRARIAALAGVPILEQKIDPNHEGGES
ncbi:MAG: hypothetical protein WAS93_03630 [Burkholderiaceae bacterium]